MCICRFPKLPYVRQFVLQRFKYDSFDNNSYYKEVRGVYIDNMVYIIFLNMENNCI